MKRTEPSPKRKLAPPVCRLRKPVRESAPAPLLSMADRAGHLLSGSFLALAAVTPALPQSMHVMPRGEPNRALPAVAVTRAPFMIEPGAQAWSRRMRARVASVLGVVDA